MKRSLLLGAAILFTALYGIAQESKKEKDLEAIKNMCGCYEVKFAYAETFAPEIDYEKKLDYTAAALELALPIEESEDKISIQHLLIVNDTMVIKHWRQDWEFENQEVFSYNKDNQWVFKSLPAEKVRGQWTQKVFQVDDSPRYSGSATWVHVDGKHYWENKTDAPLPRREYSKRSDYNIMKRGNRHEITEYGWIHEQDNDKIIREEGQKDVLLAQEKGMNTYTKVADEKCRLAVAWWEDHKEFWAMVRDSWEDVYDREGELTLHKKVDDMPLYRHFYGIENDKIKPKKVDELIAKFIVDSQNSEQIEGK